MCCVLFCTRVHAKCGEQCATSTVSSVACLETTDGTWFLDVATLGMVVGEVCSALAPCWPVLGSNGLVISDDTTELGSVDAVQLISVYAGGKSAVEKTRGLYGAKGQMVAEGLLRVLDVISPGSYFFAYAHEHKLYALPTSDACSSISTVWGHHSQNAKKPPLLYPSARAEG